MKKIQLLLKRILMMGLGIFLMLVHIMDEAPPNRILLMVSTGLICFGITIHTKKRILLIFRQLLFIGLGIFLGWMTITNKISQESDLSFIALSSIAIALIWMGIQTDTNPNRFSTNNYDAMTGEEFEIFCAELLKANGYSHVKITPVTGDYGIDILAKKKKTTYAIQCKCYSSNLGNSAVQEAFSGKTVYKSQVAVVLTNRYFTAHAMKTAKATQVQLWDRDTLNAMIAKAKS